MKDHLAKRSKLLSYLAAGLVGFALGVSSLRVGVGAFIAALIFDFISGAIEQNKKNVQTSSQTEREL